MGQEGPVEMHGAATEKLVLCPISGYYPLVVKPGMLVSALDSH